MLYESLDRWKHSLDILKSEVLETANVQVLFIYLFYYNHDQKTNKQKKITKNKKKKHSIAQYIET